jgi:NAD+ kinase
MKIEFEEKSSDIILTFDGQAALEINNSDTIIIQKGLHPVNMIMMPDQNYFDVLKAKLRWSGARM